MRKKNVLAFGVAALSLVAAIPSIGVFAAGTQTIEVTGDTAEGSADTDFVVTADMLGGGLVVTIPDKVTLDYNKEDNVFKKDTTVNAKGYVDVDKELTVEIPTAVTYTLENNASYTADGTVAFGTASGDNQVTEWSQTELKTKSEGTLVGIDKALSVTVDGDDVDDIGIYKTELIFTIELQDK